MLDYEGDVNNVYLGDRITVQTFRGFKGNIIGRLPDGLVVLFDQNSQYFDLLAPGQSVEGHIVNVQENYVIMSPIREPEEIEISYVPELEVDDIVGELEKLIEGVSGNAEVIPRALLRVIQLEQLIIKILTGEA